MSDEGQCTEETPEATKENRVSNEGREIIRIESDKERSEKEGRDSDGSFNLIFKEASKDEEGNDVPAEEVNVHRHWYAANQPKVGDKYDG